MFFNKNIFFIDYMYFSCRPSSFPHKISRFFTKNIYFFIDYMYLPYRPYSFPYKIDLQISFIHLLSLLILAFLSFVFFAFYCQAIP